MVPLVNKAALAPGTVVAGKYVVNRFIGAGGMAQVYEALNRDIDERVALKVIHPAFRNDPSVVAKFRFEACSAARIRSEFVARVFDVASTQDGFPVIVMEFLEGLDLRSWIDAHGLPSTEMAVGWIIEACGGLAVAHANGIVHRDVKPENLFIAEELGGRTQVKLLDFGISRSALTHNPTRAESGEHGAMRIIGTPTYMSPEQITSSRAADPRVDVWSIGILLHELFTGTAPFSGDTPEATCLAILENRKADLRLLRPDLPSDLVDVVERCLARQPEARPPSVADVAAALYPFAHDQHAISVDRTVTLLRSAGLTDAESPRQRAPTLPDLVPPARTFTPLPTSAAPEPLASSPPIGPPSTPALATGSAPPAAPSALMASPGPGGVAPVATSSPPGRARSVALVLLLLAVCAGVAFYFGTRRTTTEPVASTGGPAPHAETPAANAKHGETPDPAPRPSAALDGAASTEPAAGAPPTTSPTTAPQSRGSRASRDRREAPPAEPTTPAQASASSKGRPAVQVLPDDTSKVRIIE